MKLPIAAVLAAFACISLATELTMPLLTFYPSDNLGIDYATGGGAWFIGIHGAVGALTGIMASSSLDRLPALRTAAGGALLSAVAHASIPVAQLMRADPTLVAILLCVLAPAASVIANAAVGLCMKRLLVVYYLGESELTAKTGEDRFFSIMYALFNGMAVLADIIYDVLRTNVAPSHAVANDWCLYGAGALMLMAAAILLVTTRCCVRAADRAPVPADPKLGMSPVYAICCDGVTSRRFWRFMVFCTALLGVRSLFRHVDSTLSIYMTRTEGANAHFALVQAVNPFLVVVFVGWAPTLVFSRFSTYTRVVVGTCLSVAAPLLLGVANGTPSGSGGIVGLVAMVALFTLGEMAWSPILMAYASRVSPQSTLAVFNALASLPALAVALPTSAVSAALVETFCPALGVCDGTRLWLVIGLIAASSPLVLLFGERWLRENEVDSEGL